MVTVDVRQRKMNSISLSEFLTTAERRCIESSDSFDLPDPCPDTHDLFVYNAEFKEETYWIICRRHARNHAYVGRGKRRQYVQCICFGCPEHVRQDCVLSRIHVLEFAGLLP